ncbi:DUF6011 domain-containing protein [Amycolatopsis sp. NPDC001319]|uniref:DUF6011 domain-containing protein n=1 Tax=unclassified Amycolatopsis TaxID=2618356 RepID=UPI003694D3D7
MTATVCGSCSRPLKGTQSRGRGYGPVCYRRKFGEPPPRLPRVVVRVHGLGWLHDDPHPVDPNQIPLPLETLVDAETRKAAIDQVARHALTRQLDLAVEFGRIDWGDYDELVERDFDAVLARVQQISDSMRPTIAAYQAAYEHLTPTVQEGQPR